MGSTQCSETYTGNTAWNAHKQACPKRALKIKEIWSIRFFLDTECRLTVPARPSNRKQTQTPRSSEGED